MTTPSPEVVTAEPGAALRIVLFGMPDAGKSSLLGAFARASQTHKDLIQSKFIDTTHGLAELQRRLYEDRPRETLEEVVPYLVKIEPWTAKDGTLIANVETVLVDCDGRAANALLEHSNGLEGNLSKRRIAQAILGADALVLVIDAAAEQNRLKINFDEFVRFLKNLQVARGRRTEIGGLPVFLVLTKCDLLARADDTTAMWLKRIEEHKRTVRQRFEEFLSQQALRDQTLFGKIDLHVWATAVKRPALRDAPARPKEPYGVAELFQQAIESARSFRERGLQAIRRLGWLVGGLAFVVCLMSILAFFFLSARAETELGQFQKELRSLLSSRGDSPAQRLHEPLGKSIEELRAFRDHPLFAKISPELQKETLDQLREAEAFNKLLQEFQAAAKSQHLREAPRFAQNESELNDFRTVLEQHPVPEEYRTAWEDTELVSRQRRWRDEIEIMESEVKAAVKAFGELQQLDLKLKDRKKYTGEELDQLLEELKLKDKNLPYRIDNHTNIRNSRVTYSNVAQFEPVGVLLARYEKIRQFHHLDGAK
jgi:GTPase SAR1 family protein